MIEKGLLNSRGLCVTGQDDSPVTQRPIVEKSREGMLFYQIVQHSITGHFHIGAQVHFVF